MKVDLHSLCNPPFPAVGLEEWQQPVSLPVGFLQRKSENKTSSSSHLQTDEIIRERNGLARTESLYLLVLDNRFSLWTLMMKWHVFATAGLPFPSPGALLILRRLIRASGVPKDVLFSHFIKLHSFIPVVANMILVNKNFWVVLMTLDCLQFTTWKKKTYLSLTLRRPQMVNPSLCFTWNFVSPCSEKILSLDCSSLICSSWVPVGPVC